MPTALLADADVLIDYRESELSILRLAGQKIGPLKVISAVLKEVHNVTAKDCAKLGIDVVEVETDRMIHAAAIGSRISFNDRLCLITCLEEGWTCVTNDRALRKSCAQHGVKTRFGLGLMLDLVACGKLSQRQAVAIARKIQTSNPMHINERVFGEYLRRLERVVGH